MLLKPGLFGLKKYILSDMPIAEKTGVNFPSTWSPKMINYDLLNISLKLMEVVSRLISS